jgi:hypothetical protein
MKKTNQLNYLVMLFLFSGFDILIGVILFKNYPKFFIISLILILAFAFVLCKIRKKPEPIIPTFE